MEEFAFAHALTRETVYGSLSATRAARRHAQVARVLDQRPEAAAWTAPTGTAPTGSSPSGRATGWPPAPATPTGPGARPGRRPTRPAG